MSNYPQRPPHLSAGKIRETIIATEMDSLRDASNDWDIVKSLLKYGSVTYPELDSEDADTLWQIACSYFHVENMNEEEIQEFYADWEI